MKIKRAHAICGIIHSSLARFFRNKGAVAGVFLIVGLATASIFLFLFFFIRRRRRTRRLEHDTAVASTLAAAGFNRTPVDGDDDDRNPNMRQNAGSHSPFGGPTLSSIPSASRHTLGSAGGRPPSGYLDEPSSGSTPIDFDPYAPYGNVPPPPAALTGTRKDGYMPARTSSPPPGAAPLPHSRNHSLSSSSGGMMGGHTARESAGSFEPLLHAYRQGHSPPDTPGPTPTTNLFVPDVPPRNPARTSGNRSAEGSQEGYAILPTSTNIRDSASSVYSEADDQLIDLTPTTKLEVRRITAFDNLKL